MAREKIVRINTALHPELLRRIDFYATDLYEDRSTAIRQLIAAGLKEKLRDKVLEAYKKGRLTIRQAAELLGIDYWEMQELLKEAGIPVLRAKRE